ncbi:hypothetical protein ABZY30_25790 [Streptomyces massasporeus]|jgi:hypothetical protein|uniref:hypothetical protein n=1 Tax=Streptomyces massasporeus TaxID=67324 RepID=UPI0011504977
MTTEALAGLAAAGGAALVGAMATDTWQTARTCFLRLLGRDGRRDAIEGQLETQADVVERATEGRREEARTAFLPGWRLQLADFLQHYPEAEEELRQVIEQVRSELPETYQRKVEAHLEVCAGRDAYTSAHDITVTHHHGTRSSP